jgi:N-hydroxyarylamine O-acetyltransferase
VLDLAAYLDRVDLSGAPGEPEGLAPNLESLSRLQEAHCAAIPFENLDVLLGRPILLDLASLQAKLVGARRGGYCFEHNTLFAAILEAVGFRVTRLAARVRIGDPAPRPRTHMLLRVDLTEGAFLVDVGFGGEGPLVPVPFAPGAETEAAGVRHRLIPEGPSSAGVRVLQADVGGGFTDLYAFTEEPQLAVDYEMANHFTSTYPRSPFVLNLTAQRARRDRRAILRNRDLAVREAGRISNSVVRDPDHLLLVLESEFGLAFPPGTRFPKPDFA